METNLQEQAQSLPQKPGVYLFKNDRGNVIYVGKADNLKVRVRQYLVGSDDRFMIPFLVSNASQVDVIVTASTKEALLLERTLIQNHQPRFNALYRDDSYWLHLRIDPKSKWPRFTTVRQTRKDGAVYFGPFHSAGKARKTLAFVERAFPLRTCTDAVLRARKRPCLLYQMKRCCGPCVYDVPQDEYGDWVDQAMTFLRGRHDETQKRLKTRMFDAADAEEFEEAARLRDLIADIGATVESQRIIDPKQIDRDVWGLYRVGHEGAIGLISYRKGVMGEPWVRQIRKAAGTDAQWLYTALSAHYENQIDIPKEVIVPNPPEDALVLAEWISDQAGHRVQLNVPERGQKKKLVELAQENAKLKFNQASEAHDTRRSALEELTQLLHLPYPPYRMECFDNSNLGGAHPVAAMAVFVEGRPARKEYRRYRIKTVVGADDYASMKEIIGRRMKRALDAGAPPDLIVVDGGRGQLNAALEALEALGVVNQPIIGLSKPRTERKKGDRQTPDKIIHPDYPDPIILDPNSSALRVLQYLRDETHNHAIKYHRKVRRRDTILSVLEAIPGVGPSRCKTLLRALGSAQAVADADVDTLAKISGIGPVLARQIRDTLNAGPGE